MLPYTEKEEGGTEEEGGVALGWCAVDVDYHTAEDDEDEDEQDADEEEGHSPLMWYAIVAE